MAAKANAMIIAKIAAKIDNMSKLNFLKKLSYLTHKRRGNDPFELNDLVNDSVLVNQYKSDVDALIENGFFFLKKTNDNRYVKTYRIPEICDRTIKELKKANINHEVMMIIEKNPIVLHNEFNRWLNTKHKSMLSYILDKYWHNFMLYSYEYNSWCYDNVGYFVYHVPTPYYEKNEFTSQGIILENIEFFLEYTKRYALSETLLLYNLPYKLLEENQPLDKIKRVFLDLIHDAPVNSKIKY